MANKAPADLAQVIDPLKEWFTWKWVGLVVSGVLAFLGCFILTTLSIMTGRGILISLVPMLLFGISAALFLWYARTPNVLEDNWRGILHWILIKLGINTFSKYNSRVRRWAIRNFTGLKEIDEETGLCNEMTNMDMI